MTAPVILWLRNDLRLSDHPALHAAVDSGAPILPLYILDDDAAGKWKPGAASRWWLHHSLASLDEALKKQGASLVLRRGDSAKILMELVEKTGAKRVVWSRRYEPFAIQQDKAIKAKLKGAGVAVDSFNAALVHEPWEIAQKSGGPYKVYTPYSRAWFDMDMPPAPLAAPERIDGVKGIASDRLEDWDLLPTKPDWSGGMRDTWTPGEAAAQREADRFLDRAVERYGDARNDPSDPGTSRMSPHLRFGEIGPRQLAHAAAVRHASKEGYGASFAWVRQICWRDFAYHNLYHFPHLPEEPLRPEFADFPWDERPGHLKAWQKGLTGYPIVDAGMRELWHTGWMHNRLRMITGSFLTKDLLVPWQKGAAWYWDCLCDGDLANNSMGWQWVTGCGIDAAPYFRVFNPVTQGEKFDPKGDYVRRWVPELAKLPPKLIHRPFEAPEDTLTAAGIELGSTYPKPIVDHGHARQRALAAFQDIRAAA